VYKRGGQCVSLHALPYLVARSGVSYLNIDAAQVELLLLPSSWQRKYVRYGTQKDGKCVALQRDIGRRCARGALRASCCRLALTELIHYGYSPLLRLEPGSGRSHKETWAGCSVSLTTPTSSSFSASRSVSSLNLAEKASSVFLASYLLR
jgi:hypothetical protein